MSFEIEGTISEIYPEQQVSQSFKKREFVLEHTERNYTEHIKFQLTQDKCNILNNLNTNDQVKVHFNIRGRRWEKDGNISYFTNLEAWRIEKLDGNNGNGSFVDRESDYQGIDIPPPGPDDDLPF